MIILNHNQKRKEIKKCINVKDVNTSGNQDQTKHLSHVQNVNLIFGTKGKRNENFREIINDDFSSSSFKVLFHNYF